MIVTFLKVVLHISPIPGGMGGQHTTVPGIHLVI